MCTHFNLVARLPAGNGLVEREILESWVSYVISSNINSWDNIIPDVQSYIVP